MCIAVILEVPVSKGSWISPVYIWSFLTWLALHSTVSVILVSFRLLIDETVMGETKIS